MKSDQPPGPAKSKSQSSMLRGKRILVTRTLAQSADITAHLAAFGATVIHCPTIEVVPPRSWAPADESIARLEQYDWLVFTSTNGAEFFFRRVHEMRPDFQEAIAGLIICAIGPATADAIEAAGEAADVVASDSKAEGVLKAIIDRAGGAEHLRGLKFLIPQARVTRDLLPSGLRDLGASVDAVETYQTIKPDLDGKEMIRLFEEHSIDVVTFTSPSTVSNFSALVGLIDLSGLLSHTIVACIGPVTAKTAAKHGLEKIIQPGDYSIRALVDSIVQAIGQN